MQLINTLPKYQRQLNEYYTAYNKMQNYKNELNSLQGRTNYDRNYAFHLNQKIMRISKNLHLKH